MRERAVKSLLNKRNWIVYAIIVAAFFIPMFLRTNYQMSVMVNCLLFAAMGFSWNIISGYGGQISLCHAGFIAIGAYTSFIMYNDLGISPILSMPIGMLVCYVFATIMGKVTLRYRGPFFTISTVVFIELLKVLLLYFSDLTKGSTGIIIAYTKPDPWNLLFPNNKPYYYISLCLLLLCMVVTWLFINSKRGYFLRAIKGDQDASLSLGIDIGQVKLISFQLSAVMTSVVGSIYALYMTYIEPSTICSTDLSIRICAIVIIGGMGRFYGPLIGSFILIPLSEVALRIFPDGGAQLFYGLGLIAIVLAMPGGIVSLLADKLYPMVKRRMRRGEERVV